MSDLYPDEKDPLRRRVPKPITPKDLGRTTSPDIIGLIQQLLARVERLEKDMRTVKKKLKIPTD